MATLDEHARDAIERFVRILLRCGFSQAAITGGVVDAFESLPRNMIPLPPDAEREVPEAAHLLTLWHHEPDYVDEHGQPRKLRRRGPQPSFEALVKGVNASLDVDCAFRRWRTAEPMMADSLGAQRRKRVG